MNVLTSFVMMLTAGAEPVSSLEVVLISEPSEQCEKLFDELELRDVSEVIEDEYISSKSFYRFIPFIGQVIQIQTVMQVIDSLANDHVQNYLDHCGEIYVTKEIELRPLFSEYVEVPRGAIQYAGAGVTRNSYIEYETSKSAEIGLRLKFLETKLGAYDSTTFGESVSIEQNQQVQMNGDSCQEWEVGYYDRVRPGYVTDPYLLKGAGIPFVHVLGPAVRAKSKCN